MKVYSTVLFFGVSAALEQADPAGRCFKDRQQRHLPFDLPVWGINGLPRWTEESNVEHCKQHCGQLGHFYAGLQAQSVCFCGNEYGAYGEAPASDCDRKCLNKAGGADEFCGGGWRNNIHRANIIYSHEDGPWKRNSADLVASMNLADLSSHGCWCARLSGTSDLEGGDTIDAVDELCKEWFMKRRCLNLPGGACTTFAASNEYSIDTSNGSVDEACPLPMKSCGGATCRVDEDMRRKIQVAVDELRNNGLEYPKVSTTCGAVGPNQVNPTCTGYAPDILIQFP